MAGEAGRRDGELIRERGGLWEAGRYPSPSLDRVPEQSGREENQWECSVYGTHPHSSPCQHTEVGDCTLSLSLSFNQSLWKGGPHHVRSCTRCLGPASPLPPTAFTST
ncbi:hypothetical protein UPYG_G00267230 [Umbra pygmaea]|uniref:Uncharacterized protein n=1 Tax=Umbra pygmaea TaxID=75934 RepID=A0ABD0WA56_UMBPY